VLELGSTGGGVEVSVIIPAYNASATVIEQLEAVTQQRGCPPFEVVVADNGSGDSTAALVERFTAPVDVRLVHALGRRGASHARNVGALAARGRTLAFCDADDVVDESWLAHLLRAHRESERVIVAGRLSTDHNDHVVRASYGVGAAERENPGASAALAPFAGFLPTVGSGNFAVSRDDFLRVGGMDESYRGGSEDTDFAWRAQLAGSTVVAAPHACVRYRLRSTGRALFCQQRRYQRERILLWVRFKDRGMHGPSLRFSILGTVRGLLTSPAWAWSRNRRLPALWLLGGHVGAVEGMLRYRWPGRPPKRRLLTDRDNASQVRTRF
jgi:GT2 family glycosyltransferase